MVPTATGSKARWAPQARRKACMGCSWAAACSVEGRGISQRGLPPTACYALFLAYVTVLSITVCMYVCMYVSLSLSLSLSLSESV